jgi:hypothetical protein
LPEALEHGGDSVWLLEGTHHVFHGLAKGGLRKSPALVFAALEALEPGESVPCAACHELAVKVSLAPRQALEMLEKLKKP